MGIVSRRIFPTCGSMCVCCPALRSRSRQPVKRYKKLLAEIFPKSLDGPPNERKILKLCEYALKNPFRIPKIAKYLEERCYKEMRCEHIKFITVITETYNGLLCMCKEQMAYFAISLLNVVTELLDNGNPKQDAARILGCQTITRFIYCQSDGIYAHNIENLVHKVCMLAREAGEDSKRRCLRAASLQCLSAMVWFMAEFSTIFVDFDEIVYVTLDNLENDMHAEDDSARSMRHHNWVDEVIRRDQRGIGSEHNPSWIITRPRPEKKDPSLLTREETETPKVWAQICIQRFAELAKESTTMRRVLDPMFVYFDTGCHWVSDQGLAMMVLSDMSYFLETTGNPQLILSAIIRHLGHKNVANDSHVKSCVIQVAAALARQIRSDMVLAEIGCVSDLCRHLRKSLQANFESVGDQESNLNIRLQHCIEDCLLEITKGIGDARPLYDIMAVTLEKLPSVGFVARATIGSLIILAHTISLASRCWHLQQVCPEALLVQLLKVMLHPDVEARAGAHQIFSALLIPVLNCPRNDALVRVSDIYEPKRWHCNTASAFTPITALLEKLRREKYGTKSDKSGNTIRDDYREKDNCEEERKQGWPHKNSPNLCNISSIVDVAAGSTCFAEPDPFIIKFTEDQITQLLSGFWIQATLPDNLPSNFEAIGHSFSLTLVASRLKLQSPNDNLVVRLFQLPLSLRNMSLGPNSGMLPPARQRSVLVLSMGMLMFAAKMYHVPQITELLKSVVPYDVDSYVGINDDLQVYVKPQMDARQYGSYADNQAAASLLFELRDKICESESMILEILSQNLSSITELEAEELIRQLSEEFTPDEAFMFGPQSILDSGHIQVVSQSKESLSFDGDFLSNSPVEDDAKSDRSVADSSRLIPKLPTSSPVSQIISIGQLMESALEIAGQVAGSFVSTSTLPYSTMASQCEALGTGTKKLSTWLTHESGHCIAANKGFPAVPADAQLSLTKIKNESRVALLPEPWMAVRLPPASPFDNFLRAARY